MSDEQKGAAERLSGSRPRGVVWIAVFVLALGVRDGLSGCGLTVLLPVAEHAALFAFLFLRGGLCFVAAWQLMRMSRLWGYWLAIGVLATTVGVGVYFVFVDPMQSGKAHFFAAVALIVLAVRYRRAFRTPEPSSEASGGNRGQL